MRRLHANLRTVLCNCYFNFYKMIFHEYTNIHLLNLLERCRNGMNEYYYSDIITNVIATQLTGVRIVCSGGDQLKHQSSMPLSSDRASNAEKICHLMTSPSWRRHRLWPTKHGKARQLIHEGIDTNHDLLAKFNAAVMKCWRDVRYANIDLILFSIFSHFSRLEICCYPSLCLCRNLAWSELCVIYTLME